MGEICSVVMYHGVGEERLLRRERKHEKTTSSLQGVWLTIGKDEDQMYIVHISLQSICSIFANSVWY